MNDQEQNNRFEWVRHLQELGLIERSDDEYAEWKLVHIEATIAVPAPPEEGKSIEGWGFADTASLFVKIEPGCD